MVTTTVEQKSTPAKSEFANTGGFSYLLAKQPLTVNENIFKKNQLIFNNQNITFILTGHRKLLRLNSLQELIYFNGLFF